jgi:hypothetical protein
MGQVTVIAAVVRERVAAQLPADGGRRAAQVLADPAQGVAGLAPEFDLHPLAQAQVVVGLSHRGNTLEGVALQM